MDNTIVNISAEAVVVFFMVNLPNGYSKMVGEASASWRRGRAKYQLEQSAESQGFLRIIHASREKSANP
ncbi:MAG: hypothetical protein ABWY05_07630 [Noviherbaspirillum sp.]